MLSQKQVSDLLKKYKIPQPPLKIITREEKLDSSLPYPIVMKIVSPKIIHKSDLGGVVLNVHNTDEAKKVFRKFKTICKRKRVTFGGAMIQPQKDGHYVIIGLKNDPQFGPVVMFGSGGIFVEVMKDVTFRVCPVTQKDALEMIKEIKGYPILNGVRGKRTDINRIAKVIKAVSDIGMKENIQEMDINPLVVWKDGVSAVDVRVQM